MFWGRLLGIYFDEGAGDWTQGLVHARCACSTTQLYPRRKMVIFLTSLFLRILLAFCYKEEPFLLPHLFFQVWPHGFCFTQWIIVLCCHYLVWCSAFPRSDQWCPFRLAPLFFVTCALYFLSALLFSDTIRCSRFMLSFPDSSPEISHFSKEPGSF